MPGNLEHQGKGHGGPLCFKINFLLWNKFLDLQNTCKIIHDLQRHLWLSFPKWEHLKRAYFNKNNSLVIHWRKVVVTIVKRRRNWREETQAQEGNEEAVSIIW